MEAAKECQVFRLEKASNAWSGNIVFIYELCLVHELDNNSSATWVGDPFDSSPERGSKVKVEAACISRSIVKEVVKNRTRLDEIGPD
jgi:hypothetical protein